MEGKCLEDWIAHRRAYAGGLGPDSYSVWAGTLAVHVRPARRNGFAVFLTVGSVGVSFRLPTKGEAIQFADDVLQRHETAGVTEESLRLLSRAVHVRRRRERLMPPEDKS